MDTTSLNPATYDLVDQIYLMNTATDFKVRVQLQG